MALQTRAGRLVRMPPTLQPPTRLAILLSHRRYSPGYSAEEFQAEQEVPVGTRVGRTDRVVQLLSDLVAIESVNPFFEGGERGEVAVADFVEGYCRRAGLDVSRQTALPG